MRFARSLLGLVLLAAVITTQYAYDIHRAKGQSVPTPPITAPAARLADLGLHSALAAFGWVSSMSDIITVSDKNKKFLDELSFVNGVEPKLSFPYAFTVLVLPGMKKYSDRVATALEIGERGTRDAAPDWRIPFYTATTFYLDRKDKPHAIHYFDIASRTPGAPYYIKRFSENFGIAKRDRDATREIWKVIYESAKDNDTRIRAKAYIDRLDIFDFLEQAAVEYKKKFGSYPKNISDLVSGKILRALPSDPFDFTLKLDPATGEAGIVTTD